jgi:hypothetical protein
LAKHLNIPYEKVSDVDWELCFSILSYNKTFNQFNSLVLKPS